MKLIFSDKKNDRRDVLVSSRNQPTLVFDY